jgi:hypothetical protein
MNQLLPHLLPVSGRSTLRLLLMGVCLTAAVSTLAAPPTDPPGRYDAAGNGGRGDVPKATGLHVEFYRGINFEYIEHVRKEEQVDYQWAHPIYAQGLEGLEFSARWTGRLRAPVDGMYRLCLEGGRRGPASGWPASCSSTSGTKSPNNSITLRVKPVTFTAEVHLKKGQYYDLKIEYFNYLGPGVIKLYWESPQTETEHFFGLITQRKRELVPAEFLSGPPEKPATQPAPPTGRQKRPEGAAGDCPSRPWPRREPAAAKPAAAKARAAGRKYRPRGTAGSPLLRGNPSCSTASKRASP